FTFLVRNKTTEHDRLPVFDRDFGISLAVDSDGDIVVVDLLEAAQGLNTLADIHDHESVHVDERQHRKRDADLQLRILGGGARSPEVTIGAGDVRTRLTDEQVRLDRMRRLNAWAREDVNAIIRGDGLRGDIQVAAQTSKITEAAGQNAVVRAGLGENAFPQERHVV